MRGTNSRAALCAVIVSLGIAACQEAPVTGRSQMILLPDDQAAQMGADAYKKILKKGTLSKDPALNRRVNQVGRRIAAVADDPGYKWQFKVLKDKTPNAFALPGGKVGVNTGLFKVAKNDDQLAAVMAHEIGHAIARHSAERMSRQMMIQSGLGIAGAASGTSAGTIGLIAQAATLGVVLPFTRDQESEADEIGLYYMAKAGYDPRESVKLWRNFASYGGDRPPEFLSTHPAPETRIQDLKALMPQALQVYRANKGRYAN